MRLQHVAWTAAAWSLLTILVATHAIDAVDARLHDVLAVSEQSAWAGLWHAATFVGDLEMMGIMTAAAALYLVRVGRFWDGVLLGGATLVAQGVSRLVKVVMARPRPDGGLVETSTDSFPSGHALVPTVLLLAWALLAGDGRRAAWAAAGALAFAIGASRVALGVHYVSDVVAGWLLAALLMAAVVRLRSTIRRGRGGATPAA